MPFLIISRNIFFGSLNALLDFNFAQSKNDRNDENSDVRVATTENQQTKLFFLLFLYCSSLTLKIAEKRKLSTRNKLL